VRVNGQRVEKGTQVHPGDLVTVPRLVGVQPEPELALRVVYEAADLAVVEKPGGMPSHALDPREAGTAAAFVVARWPETRRVGNPLAPGLAHRLDTGTSGLLVVARSPACFATLRGAFAQGRVDKQYLAIVAGTPPARVTLRQALAHDRRDRRRMAPAEPGTRSWPAETRIETLAVVGTAALVAATIRTGVTHQVRVHLAMLGHPVLGDALYGGPPAGLAPGRHALHASALTIAAPGRPLLSVRSPLPADLAALLS